MTLLVKLAGMGPIIVSFMYIFFCAQSFVTRLSYEVKHER